MRCGPRRSRLSPGPRCARSVPAVFDGSAPGVMPHADNLLSIMGRAVAAAAISARATALSSMLDLTKLQTPRRPGGRRTVTGAPSRRASPTPTAVALHELAALQHHKGNMSCSLQSSCPIEATPADTLRRRETCRVPSTMSWTMRATRYAQK
jgi:hypothetical protein